MSAAATSSPAPASKRRYEELDALRALGAVSIVVVHAYQNSRSTVGGYVYAGEPILQHFIINLDYGLSVFFALSGFVIFLPLARALIEGRRHMGVREFALRRIFRIVPLYFVAIFVVWNLRYDGASGQIADLVRHLTFTQIYNNAKIFYTIGPSWSLAAEIHYYAFTGLLLWLLTRLCRRVVSRRRRIVLVAAAPTLLALASIAYVTWAWYDRHYVLDNMLGPKHYTVYYSALARADSFAFGMLLAVVVALMGQWRARGPALPRALTAAALLAWLVMAALRDDTLGDSTFVALYYYTFVGIGTIAVMFAIVISDPEWPTMRLLRWGPLQTLALISYSLYLWHEPIMLGLEHHHILVFKGESPVWPLSCLALLVAATAVAWVSYHVIEAPGERLRGLLRVPRADPDAIFRRVGGASRSGALVGTLPVLRGEDGAPVDLQAIAGGRPLVAFMQPPAQTAGVIADSAAEARAFRDSCFLFDALGVGVVGVSSESPEALGALREREHLPFPLLSDPECAFASAAGVPLWTDGRGRSFADRAALVIDRFGVIREMLGSEIHTAGRPGVAAAHGEALLA